MPAEDGAHADAARARERALIRQIQGSAAADQVVAATVRGAYQGVLRGRARLDAIGVAIENAAANQQALALDTPAGARRFSAFLAAEARDIQRVVEHYAADSKAKAALLRSLAGYENSALGYGTGKNPRWAGVVGDLPLDGPNTAEDGFQRRQNQAGAFRQVFGREPVSTADWATAAALDPHSYEPKYQGVGPEIRVARIRPVPGQGVVRSSQWIAQRDVTSFPFLRRDLGNNRGPDTYFDPEDTKVTTYVDYENGMVVMRQNPSVRQNSDGSPGRVLVGAPQGSVTQAADGSVRIRYDAGNPFAPGIATNPNGPMAGHQETVNGDLVFTPGPDGVQVGGTRTNYPSMEIYQDRPDGTTRTVLIDPARSGRSWGPVLNLPRHHDVGVGGRAFAPFDTGGWNPRYDVPAPLPATPFGPAGNPPSVPRLSIGGAAAA